MPYGVRKIRNKEQWKVFDKETKEEYTTHNSLAEAKERVAHLDAIDKGGEVELPLTKKQQERINRIRESRKPKQITIEERISKLPQELKRYTASFLAPNKKELSYSIKKYSQWADILDELSSYSIGHINDYYYDDERYDIDDITTVALKYRKLVDELEKVWKTYYSNEDWSDTKLSKKNTLTLEWFGVEENEEYGKDEDDDSYRYYVNDWDEFFEKIDQLNSWYDEIREELKDILTPTPKSKIQNYIIRNDINPKRLTQWMAREGYEYKIGGVWYLENAMNKATEDGRVINSESEVYPLSKWLADRNYISLKKTDREDKNDRDKDLEDSDMEGEGLSKACWKGYEAVGMKKKGKRMVPNCVPIKGGKVKFFYINPKEELLGKKS